MTSQLQYFAFCLFSCPVSKIRADKLLVDPGHLPEKRASMGLPPPSLQTSSSLPSGARLSTIKKTLILVMAMAKYLKQLTLYNKQLQVMLTCTFVS
jgi:hypothetical protein